MLWSDTNIVTVLGTGLTTPYPKDPTNEDAKSTPKMNIQKWQIGEFFNREASLKKNCG